MYPDLITIGNFTITSFGVMMFLAFVVAAVTTSAQLKRRNMNPDLAWDLLLWVMVGGILGAKFYYMALHWENVLANPMRELFSRGGLVWYGGFIGGAIAFFWQVRRRKLPVATMFDAAAPGLMLAYGVGRIGCFLVGDDYGIPTERWLGIAFPRGAPPSTAGNLRSAGVDVPAEIPDWTVLAVHPTQIYETSAAFLLFIVLWRLAGRQLRAGQLFGSYLFLYGLLRFGIEFIRANPDQLVFGFSTSHAASLVLVALGAFLWFRKGQTQEVKQQKQAPGKR